MEFYIGTTNPNKIREIASILSATGCTYKVADHLQVTEVDDDFEASAVAKAVAFAKFTGGITISEDSGLVVPVLHGLPGPWSARFSDCEIDVATGRVIRCVESDISRTEIDLKNNSRVLKLMDRIEQPYRAASFRIYLVVADQLGKILWKSMGESFGWISEESRGVNGFGYDPIFVGQDTFGKTYAELDSMRKNLRSHRKRVLDEFKAWLARFVKENE